MDVQTAIETRRSVKHFDPAHRMSEAERDRLIRLALLSPTAFNIQHWRFVVVEDPALRARIRQAAWNQAQVTDASLLVILCADLQAWRKEPQRYWREAPQAAQDFLLPAIHGYYEGREQVQRDETMRSCGIAGMALMLAARDLGYDSCPMDGFDFAAVGQLIHLPEDHVISFMVAIGKPLQPANPRGGQLPLEQVMIRDRWA